MHDNSDTVTYRSAVGAGVTLFAYSISLLFLEGVAASMNGKSRYLLTVLVLAGAGFATVRGVRMRLRIDGDTLEVRNLSRVRRFSLAEIDAIEVIASWPPLLDYYCTGALGLKIKGRRRTIPISITRGAEIRVPKLQPLLDALLERNPNITLPPSRNPRKYPGARAC